MGLLREIGLENQVILAEIMRDLHSLLGESALLYRPVPHTSEKMAEQESPFANETVEESAFDYADPVFASIVFTPSEENYKLLEDGSNSIAQHSIDSPRVAYIQPEDGYDIPKQSLIEFNLALDSATTQTLTFYVWEIEPLGLIRF